MTITTAIRDLFQSAYELIASVFGTVYYIFSSFFLAVSHVFREVIDLITNVFSGVLELVGGVGKFIVGECLPLMSGSVDDDGPRADQCDFSLGNIVLIGLVAVAGYAYVSYQKQQGRPVKAPTATAKSN